MSDYLQKKLEAVVDQVHAEMVAEDKAKAEAKKAAESVLVSAAEGRRLYIGNLAYATTEQELKDFFQGYLV